MRRMAARTGFASRWKLLLPAVLGPVVETAVVWSLGPRDSAAMGPQLTAPPPFDLFHDLRWISVYHNSWPLLALELVGMLVFRSLYVAWIVQAAWPRDRPPAMPRAAMRAGVFYAAAAVLLVPFVALLFGLAFTHVSYLFFVSLPPALAIVMVIHRGALAQAAGTWWRWRPTWSSLAWAGGAFLWLTVAGALISIGSLPLALAAAAGAGLLNARAAAWIVEGIALGWDRPPVRHQAMVPIALATTFAVVVGGTAVGFAADAPPRPEVQGAVTIPPSADGHPVLMAAGFNSQWNPPPKFPLPQGYVAWRYSYRGIGPGRVLQPYDASDTLQPLILSARRMAEQVDALYEAYREPVTIVAESEGAIVARTYLVRQYRLSSNEVSGLVILDMPVGLSSVYYPPPGTQGWGVGSGWILRALAAFIRGVGPLRVSPDAPFFRQIAGCQSLMEAVITAPPPDGIQQVTVQALADAVDEGSQGEVQAVRSYVVVSTHGGLIGKKSVQEMIFQMLSGTPSLRTGVDALLVRLIAAASDPWHTPSLVRGLATASAC